MTKSDLIDRTCEARKVPVGRSEQIVNAIFAAIEGALNRGERVEIRGFGSFEVRSYRGYTGRNPRTGMTVEVKPKRLAFFKVGKELKDRVQQGATKLARRTLPAPAAAAANGVARAESGSVASSARSPLHEQEIAGAPHV